MMRKWQSPWWTGIALLALIVSGLPSLAWACPMSGRVSDAATVCTHMEGGAVMPCCARGMAGMARSCFRTCCKPVNLPSSSNERSLTTVARTSTYVALGRLHRSAHAGTTLALPPLRLHQNLPLTSALATASPPFALHPQLGLRQISGRAPPAV